MTSELGQRIAFTVVALLIYRLGTHIPLPGINADVWQQLFAGQSGGVLGTFNVLAGGGVQRMAIFALSVMPYLSAAILLQLATIVSRRLRAIGKNGEQGRRTIVRYTLVLTLLMTLLQSYGIAVGLEGASNVVAEPGALFRITTVLTLTGGTLVLVWLSDAITSRGIGNGLALILALGIAIEAPAAIAGTLDLGRRGALSPGVLLIAALVPVVVIALIAWVEAARRHVPVVYAARQVGERTVAERTSPLAFKVNMAGSVPALLASWIAPIPATIVNLTGPVGPHWWQDFIGQPGRWYLMYLVLFTLLIVPCALFYCALIFDPDEAAENLKQYGGVVAGVAPGDTAAYLDHVVSRTTIAGALYLALVCLIPEVLILWLGVPYYFGGASLLIVVCTVLDLRGQAQATH
jgi:preprotein translocase subunit SecY